MQLGPESTPEAVGKAITGVQEKLAGGDELIGKIKAALGLKADATPAEVEGALAGTKQSAENTAALSAQIKTLMDERNSDKLEAEIRGATEEGKLVDSQLEWARTQTHAGLAAWRKTAPVVLPVEERKTEPVRRETTAPLSAGSKAIFEKLGLKPEEVKHAE
ncbi:hypothetical protein SDC9_195664 [bioreactor metagenome]|uniref:Mu-like prophage I protein n=1 Tax=bioreactor metagenome TaxID=1076179 RepID=A0A645IAB8_9ZZZZ